MQFTWLAASLISALLIVAPAVTMQEVYVRAATDAKGNLQIATAQRTIVLEAGRSEPGHGEPLEFVDVAVSPNGAAVGWLASIHNYAQIRFEFYSNGQRRSVPEDTAIWGWTFIGGSTRVALKKMTLHGMSDYYYELWDLSVMQRLEVFDAASGKPAPTWVKGLGARKD